MYHLVNHAMYKGLLFMGAGVVIHAMGEEQDMRRYGGLLRGLPVTYVLMLVGILALVGVPYLAGYYSKERIMGEVLMGSKVVGWLLLISGVITALYSVRLLLGTFVRESVGSRVKQRGVREGTREMLWAMGVLGVLIVGVGYMGREVLLGESGVLVEST